MQILMSCRSRCRVGMEWGEEVEAGSSQKVVSLPAVPRALTETEVLELVSFAALDKTK